MKKFKESSNKLKTNTTQIQKLNKLYNFLHKNKNPTVLHNYHRQVHYQKESSISFISKTKIKIYWKNFLSMTTLTMKGKREESKVNL